MEPILKEHLTIYNDLVYDNEYHVDLLSRSRYDQFALFLSVHFPVYNRKSPTGKRNCVSDPDNVDHLAAITGMKGQSNNSNQVYFTPTDSNPRRATVNQRGRGACSRNVICRDI